ncbi:MAG TPA: hypothetical protein PLA94_21240, partial [Myxococcota bacterium]|nr:hypothetical protein [Myxococcota bacterium]
AVGGDAPNPTKRRMAGVAEEILLHVALGRPVYIAGGFGGSARIAGTLLGLERPWVGGATGLFPSLDDDQRAFLDNHRRQLCPPPWSTLPTDEGGVLRFFDEHALGTPQWPQNGLSERENRRLFESVNPDEVAELVVRGMLVRFADS